MGVLIMRKNAKLFTPEEYMFLHQIYLKDKDDTKIFKKIKSKKGIGLDLTEIKHVKRKFAKWLENQDNGIFLPDGEMEDRGF
ncbi:hypothetical protein D6777_01685 [Candidatus Woesearchaeota archaeon]|nr:MAG: hypothetical protein D6777_01685 [Candidatus Woesearchaeota archaeon]